MMHCTHVPAEQYSLLALQFVQLAPQCWSESHDSHAPLLHHCPGAHSASIVHRQAPFAQPVGQTSSCEG